MSKTHQAIIASYTKDYPWLVHCLTSLHKFAKGYLPPVVCTDAKDAPEARKIVARTYPEATVVIKDGRPGQGFMRAQIAMMQADLLCPKADVLHFIGSDCIAKMPYDASIYADADGKPYVLYTRYDQIGQDVPWMMGVKRVLDINAEYEFMRRLPSVYPREIFPLMRARVEQVHGMAFEDYIYYGDVGHRNTSEANILGAFAYYYAPQFCHFINTQTEDLSKYPTGLCQFWSHGGLDRVVDGGFSYTSNGVSKSSSGQTPRTVINEILYSGAIIT